MAHTRPYSVGDARQVGGGECSDVERPLSEASGHDVLASRARLFEAIGLPIEVPQDNIELMTQPNRIPCGGNVQDEQPYYKTKRGHPKSLLLCVCLIAGLVCAFTVPGLPFALALTLGVCGVIGLMALPFCILGKQFDTKNTKYLYMG